MRLKDGAWAVIGAMLVLFFMGYVTDGFVFYGAFILLLIILAIDGARLWSLRADVRKISVARSLSRRDIAPGLSTCLTAKLTYRGNRPLHIRVTQPMYRSIASGFTEQSLAMAPGSTAELAIDLTPSKYNEFVIRPLRATVASFFYEDTLPLSDDKLLLHVALSQSPVRSSVMRRGASRLSKIFDNITRNLEGSDFSKMRPYAAGDKVKNIDWAMSGKAGSLIVREYEDEHMKPVFFLLDVDTSMGIGEKTEMESAIGLIGALLDSLIVDNERIGLACFSRDDVISYDRLNVGPDHIRNLKNVLSSAKPVASSGADPLRSVSAQELRQVGHAFSDTGVLGTVIEETLKGYIANIRHNGLSQAILRVSNSTSTACNIVIVTNMSMGMTSLMNCIRIANYYGHSVSVVLTPHVWHEGKDLANPGRYYEQYAELKDAMSKLRGYSVKVTDLSSTETPEDIIHDSHGGNRTTGIRG